MNALAVAGLKKRFRDVQALDDLAFDVAEGEFFCIVGPTNAGKSTLLKLIAGIHRADAGTIAIKGRDVSDLRPAARQVSLLFQNIALFPTLSGFENIAFALRQAGVEQRIIEERVNAAAKILKIEHILHRLPRTFSGGEQQRTAIGRALVRPGDLLMLDEPLTNLDARIRIALRIEFKKLHRETGQTILYVTHDQAEAMSLSDRIAVLHQGRFQQIGTPDDIYRRPANRFVATFIGSPPMNILDAELTEDGGIPHLVGTGFTIALPTGEARPAPALPRAVAFGIRPEQVKVAPARSPETPIAVDVAWVEHLGSKSILTVELGGKTLKALISADHPVQTEGPAWIGFIPQPQHFLDRQTGIFFHARP